MILFLLIGGVNHCFIILFSYWFSITTIKNAIAPQQKNIELQIHYANPFLFLLIRGVLVIGRRDYNPHITGVQHTHEIHLNPIELGGMLVTLTGMISQMPDPQWNLGEFPIFWNMARQNHRKKSGQIWIARFDYQRATGFGFCFTHVDIEATNLWSSSSLAWEWLGCKKVVLRCFGHPRESLMFLLSSCHFHFRNEIDQYWSYSLCNPILASHILNMGPSPIRKGYGWIIGALSLLLPSFLVKIWGFQLVMEVPQWLDGWFHGKSHSKMDDDWG